MSTLVSGDHLQACWDAFQESAYDLEIFMSGVRQYFSAHPRLTVGPEPTIHSVKGRVKSRSSFEKKIQRKADDGIEVRPDNVFAELTDLAGVRVLHLHQEQFGQIRAELAKRIDNEDWVLGEAPVAYTWDPEAKRYFETLGLDVRVRDTYYTSVHYLVRPRRDSKYVCEIQIRTLFEEIWGEIDHQINYPDPTQSLACREQLRVLSKIVGAGSRLVDAIVRSHAEFVRDNSTRT